MTTVTLWSWHTGRVHLEQERVTFLSLAVGQRLHRFLLDFLVLSPLVAGLSQHSPYRHGLANIIVT